MKSHAPARRVGLLRGERVLVGISCKTPIVRFLTIRSLTRPGNKFTLGAREPMQTVKILPILFFIAAAPGFGGIVTYTNSASFLSALGGAPTLVEQYGTSSAGTVIAPGTTLDGITYTSFNLIGSSTQAGFISNQFNSFSGLSLGADESNGLAQFFFDADSFSISFAPAFAIGVFFNVNANSGQFQISTPVGNAITGSASYDTSTFVFAGLISDSPFTTATISSTSGGNGTASFNIPEIALSQTSVPEPATFMAGSLGILLLAALRLRRRAA